MTRNDRTDASQLRTKTAQRIMGRFQVTCCGVELVGSQFEMPIQERQVSFSSFEVSQAPFVVVPSKELFCLAIVRTRLREIARARRLRPSAKARVLLIFRSLLSTSRKT